MKQASNKKQSITIGILGGGQLAKMLANEAYRLGLNIAIIENGDNTPAGDMTKLNFIKGWNDKQELDKFIEVSDIITLENEFIAPDVLEYIEKSREVFPSSATMKLVQDKYVQKNTFQSNNIAVPQFAQINSLQELIDFAEVYRYPFLVKTRTLGYDGYGNITIHNAEECNVAWNKFYQTRKIMAEEFIDFQKELAVMVARSKSGEIAVYPCVETIQQNHICHKVISPAKIEIDVFMQAKEMAEQAVKAINGVGVFGIEMFLTKENKILLNEIAPRPHNSGHYTIEACCCSQYENVIRAILDLPLGSTEMKYKVACMVNLLGERDGIGVPENITETLKFKNTKLHLYNKKQSRKGRKMGHITTTGDSYEEVLKEAQDAFNSFVW